MFLLFYSYKSVNCIVEPLERKSGSDGAMAFPSSIILTFAFVTITLSQKDQNFEPGRKGIVHLFEWKWSDIALECERFLAPHKSVMVGTLSTGFVQTHHSIWR